MAKPQQPELHRSGKGATDPASAKSHIQAVGPDAASGATGPVPEDNQPGHHPEEEQDKPVRRYRQRARAVVAEAEAEQADVAARQQAERTVTEGKIDARGMTFRVLEAGPQAGEPVLLLHGFPQKADAWRPILEALGGAGYHAVAPDQRGYSAGARPRGVRSYGIDELVADIEAIADQLDAQRFHLVGHDWGGAVAWALAAHRPERLRTLNVVSTPHPRALAASLPRSLQLLRSSYVGFFSLPAVPEAVLGARNGAILRRLLRTSGLPAGAADTYADALGEPGALAAALNWYRAVQPRSLFRVGPVSVPTLYVWSTGDTALGRAAAEATGRQVTGEYRFEILDGVSHWIPETASDRLWPVLADHMA